MGEPDPLLHDHEGRSAHRHDLCPPHSGNTEVVVAINNDGSVRGVLLQRYFGSHREEFNSAKFLGQFRGRRSRTLVIGKM